MTTDRPELKRLYDFRGRVAVVTGAASGIGFAIASRMAAEGASVALLDIDAVALQGAAAQIAKQGVDVAAERADVSRGDEVAVAVRNIFRRFGAIDILVNNAGIVISKPYVDYTEEEVERQVSVNLLGTHRLMSAVLPHMIERNRGGIVNISSVAAMHFTVPHAAYAASKAALVALTRDVGFEVARHGVRINAVAPGLIAVAPSATKTPYVERLSPEVRADLEGASSNRPLGHGRPEDVAAVVAFLVSEEARFVVGVTVPVAGGTDLRVSMMLYSGPDHEGDQQTT